MAGNKEKKEHAQNTSKSSKKVIRDPNVPDRSYGDFFCPICDSHMNSDAVWETHIIGSRHIKNVQKGETDSKYEDLDDVESNIKHELRNVRDPIVGLFYIHEIRRREPNVPPMYNCFLCHASIATVPLVIEHVISMKHRLNYIKENSPEEYDLLFATNLKKEHMESLVHESAMKMEQKFGRGAVKVKREKPKPLVTSYKRNFVDNHDDRLSKPSKIAKTDKSPSLRKSPDFTKKSSSRSRRSVTPRDHRDKHSDDERSRDGYRRSALMKKDLSHRDDYHRKDLSPKRDDYHRKDLSPKRDDYHRKDLSPKRDDYHRSYSKSFDRDSRKSEHDRRSKHSRSREKSPHKKSPEYGRAGSYSKEYVKKDTYSSKNTTNEYFPTDRSYQSKDDHLLPHEKIVRKSDPISQSSTLMDLGKKILALPNGIFLKIVNRKMDFIDLEGIEELDMLSKIINKAQAVLCSKLPPDAIAILKQKISQNSEGRVQKNIPGMGLPMESSSVKSNNLVQSFIANSLGRPLNSQDGQSSLNFIRDILNSTESYNSTPATSHHLNSYQSASSHQIQNINQYQTQNISPHSPQSLNPDQQQTASLNQSQYLTYINNHYPTYMNAQCPNTSVPYQSSNAPGSVPYSDSQSSTAGSFGMTLAEHNPEPPDFNCNSPMVRITSRKPDISARSRRKI